MPRKALIFVLAVGTVAGFASGVFGCHYHGMAQRQAFEDHVADVCTRAAERARDHVAPAPPAPQNQP